MKLCVVGAGPSAEGRGDEIDACDFVVRTKAFWSFSADGAGNRVDAWAHFGCIQMRQNFAKSPESLQEAESWITHTREQTLEVDDWQDRFAFMDATAGLASLTIPPWLWQSVHDRLNRHASCGVLAVAMAMLRFSPTTLALFGFDSTTRERPNYDDAKLKIVPLVSESGLPVVEHDFVAEKRALAEIGRGTWLGEPTTTKLIWPDMPEGL